MKFDIDLPKKIVNDFYDEIRHRAILEDDYCPDHNLERKYGVRKCLLDDIRTTILKKYGGEEGVSDDFGEEMKYVKLKAEPCDKEQQLAIYKRALELACEDNKRAYELQYLKNDTHIGSVDAFKSEYLRKAKEELEEQDVKDS